MKNRCAGCGKFFAWSDLYGCANEDEEWFECVACLCLADQERVTKRERGGKSNG